EVMNKNRFLVITTIVLLCFTATFSTPAQRRGQSQTYAYPPQLLEEMRRLREAALGSDYALKQTAHLTDNIGPRLSGSQQAQRAVEYVADEMRKLGLDVRLEKTMVPHWVRGVETGALTEFPGMAPGTRQKIVLKALGGGGAAGPRGAPGPEGLAGRGVGVETFNELAGLGESRVRGTIVLLNAKFDGRLEGQGGGLEAWGRAGAYRGGGASAAARLGAVAA